MESILVIILLLATHTAVGTARERPKDEDPCQSASFAREINSYCVNRVSPTSTCCESAIASVDIEGSGTAPCLCRVAAEPQLIMAGLNTTDLLAIFASCRALALGGAPLEATCEGDQLATGKETGRLLGMGTNNMYPSSALLGQNKDEPIADLPVDDLIEKDDGFAAILNDGTIMTISKDRVKPSPLPDSWKLAEIFTTGTVLRGYLTIMTVIFFWAAYKTKKIPRIFHVKSLEKTAQDDFQMLASAVYLQVSTISQALIFFTRWQEFRFKSIFSLSEQRSDPHVPVYNLSRNHDIGYSAFHSVHRKELTRFIIIIIIILGVLFSAIRPVQAAAPIINVDLKFDPQGYVGWSHDLYTVGTSLSQLEFTSTRQKVLGQQTFPHEPPAWIHVNVSDATEWAKFIMRSDNYQLSAYENIEVTHSFEEATHLFPGSIDIGFSGSYSGLNGGRRKLTDLNLNMDSAKLALWILSRYKHGASDPFLMKRALTIYVLIFEGQRFTEVDTCIKDGWNSDCYLTRPHELLVNWGTLSCGILEGWEPNPRHDDWWVKSREKTYRKALKDLQITETQAPGLLRVLVMGKACQDNIKGVHCITGNGASCSIRA